ncbi:MAG: hypothetical protein K8S55_08620 [Phycisphaerae bacterium]|nr:hypothetical protein [Phycisphaerae bacterium]
MSASPVQSVCVVLPSQNSAAIEQIANVFTRHISERCGGQVKISNDAPLTVELAIEEGFGPEGFSIGQGGKDVIRITGNDDRGLLYGIGKFLRTSRYDGGGFTPGDWRGTDAPKGSFRAIYAATHFNNFYEAAPALEVQQYLEDVALWGANAVIVHFPAWQFKGFDDPAARKILEQIRRLLKAARSVGLKVGLIQAPGQGFATAPKEILATKYPDGLARRGDLGVNVCPGNPAGHDYLMELCGQLMDEYKDVGLDYFVFWPYDEGGCGCSRCWPWGAEGYPRLSRDIALMARTKFPGLETILSTWCYDTPPAGEWEGLAGFLGQDNDWLDYVMADSHEDFPRYPLDEGVPGGLPLLNFPEISMWGRHPWGGSGANPLPARFERLWRMTGGKLVGGMPYSEGISDDMNKIVCFQFYWEPDRTADEILREYIAFEYSPDVVDDVLAAIHLLEETWVDPKAEAEKVMKAHEIIKEVDAKLPPQASRAWRWRILYLRSLIDVERLAGDHPTGAYAKAIEELVEIYHAQNARGSVHPR